MPKQQNKLRIIAGEWRGRKIPVADLPGLRPTPDRVRETLFNWLQFDVAGSRCLDLFAGSGALGLEAASRGANWVTQIENNATACRNLQEIAKLLNTAKLQCLCQDVLDYLANKGETFDLVFLDPPFHEMLVAPCCALLEEQGWITGNSKIYVETEIGFSLQNFPERWHLLKQKNVGQVCSHLFTKQLD